MNEQKWKAMNAAAMASMERMRQQSHSSKDLILNQIRNDKAAGRKNDFLMNSKRVQELLANGTNDSAKMA